jgi:ribosomal protein L29
MNSWRNPRSSEIRKATGQLENTAKLRLLRREIARAETILREKRGATT